MTCCDSCENKAVSIFKGFGTRWNDEDLLFVCFDSEIDLTGFKAQFLIEDIIKNYEDIAGGFAINLTAQETGMLPLGPTTGTLIVIDKENNKKPFSTEIPFLVKDWEGGDIKLDGFNISIDTKIEGNELKIHVTTVSDKWATKEYVDGQIGEHNLDTLAHPHIQEEIENEKHGRESADLNLQDQLDAISAIAYGYIHEQGIASAVWTVQHNLNKYPSVSVVDSSGNEIISEVKYLDKNTVQITMTGASKGRAYLN